MLTEEEDWEEWDELGPAVLVDGGLLLVGLEDGGVPAHALTVLETCQYSCASENNVD